MTNFAIYQTAFGYYKIKYEDDVIIGLARLLDQTKPADFGTKTALTDKVYQQLEEYFKGKRKTFDFTYKLTGTAFQNRVWQALCQIPYGETRSYKDIAIAVGSPKAYRAVGMANNKNKFGIVVPCHRVIGSNGKLIGFAGGLDIKRALLELEGALKK